jgi:hypothetical protein
VLSSGNVTTFEHTGLTSSTVYYYKAFSYTADKLYSVGLPASAATLLEPTLAVDPLTINVPAQAGNTPVMIYSNTDWSIASNQTWCTLPVSGTGNTAVMIDYAENPMASSRVANITVTVQGLPAITVTLIQAAALPTLAVTPPNQNVTDPSGVTEFTVTSNADWAVSSDQTWCTVNTPGTGNGTIQANFQQNPTVNTRVANISVIVNGLSTIVVTVTQAGAAPMLAITPALVSVNAYASSVDFTVTSNTEWTATADSAWCIVTPSGSGNGVITASYPFNPSGKVRSTKISVNAQGVSTQIATLSQGHETASVPEFGSKGFMIYPNPARGIFSVVVDKTKYPSMQVGITDATGSAVTSRECKGESEYMFDLSESPQGTYFVKVIAGTESQVTKLVIIK